MTSQDFLALVEANGGNEALVMVIHDNAGRTIFTDGFQPDQDIKDECFVVKTTDPSGIVVRILKPIETVQQIVFVENPEERQKVRTYYFSP